MRRLSELDEALLTKQQREIITEAAGGLRGRMPAQMAAWIASPVMADRAQKLGEFLRYRTQLGSLLSELAILVTARFWTSQYEWYVHAPIGREAGLAESVIEAIRERRIPDFAEEEDQRIVYEVACSIHEHHGLDDTLFQQANDILGAQCLAELVGLLGYYTLVSMTLNVYGIDVPENAVDPLDP
jgi:4-carboxymuconolactone decarboxylase